MNDFIAKKNHIIVDERVKILNLKIKLKLNPREFVLYDDNNLLSYVRTMFLLGEPCWGRYSTLNNHIDYSYIKSLKL